MKNKPDRLKKHWFEWMFLSLIASLLLSVGISCAGEVFQSAALMKTSFCISIIFGVVFIVILTLMFKIALLSAVEASRLANYMKKISTGDIFEITSCSNGVVTCQVIKKNINTKTLLCALFFTERKIMPQSSSFEKDAEECFSVIELIPPKNPDFEWKFVSNKPVTEILNELGTYYEMKNRKIIFSFNKMLYYSKIYISADTCPAEESAVFQNFFVRKKHQPQTLRRPTL